MKKFFSAKAVVIVIVLALVAVLLFATLGRVCSIMVSDWKEYEGDGFNLKYPANWVLTKSVDAEGNPGINLSSKDVFLYAAKRPIGEPGVNYFDDPKSFYGIYEDNPQFKAIDNYKFDGKRAVFVSFKEPLSGEYWELYWVKLEHYRYDIWLIYKPSWRFFFNKIIAERILSSIHLAD